MSFKRKNYICGMKKLTIEIPYEVYSFGELNEEDRNLVETAREATRKSYAPYSKFHVGAAALLENGIVVTGNNQENVAYPSGLCAERTALFYANSQYPEVAVKALAIAARHADGTPHRGIITPCGACRQVMLETEKRFGTPMRILLCGEEEIYVIESVKHLLPLCFEEY
jgi:cytidine deaminase